MHFFTLFNILNLFDVMNHFTAVRLTLCIFYFTAKPAEGGSPAVNLVLNAMSSFSLSRVQGVALLLQMNFVCVCVNVVKVHVCASAVGSKD